MGYCPRHKKTLPGSSGERMRCAFCGNTIMYANCSKCSEENTHPWCDVCHKWYCKNCGRGMPIGGDRMAFLCKRHRDYKLIAMMQNPTERKQYH